MMRNATWISLFALVSMSPMAVAMPIPPQPHIELNTVTYRLSEMGWVSSDTAKVTIAVDASLQQAKLDHIHKDITDKLATLSNKADWHITVFQRTKNESGLEQVHAQATARLPLANLGDIRQQAKKVSSPGETFRVDDIDYSPSEQEIASVHSDLRQRIYKQVKAELARINGIYSDQHYYLHRLEFTPLYPPAPQPMRMKATAPMNGAALGGDGMQMSQQLTDNAIVTLASTPKIN